jgi:uncharacterized cupin superfamily protein
MSKLNLADLAFEYDDTDPDGFGAGVKRLGRLLGATTTSTNVYELPPGQALCPYHYEYGEEEWLLVLSGTPLVRTPEGESRLGEWDVCVFPRGPEGAHSVRNDTDTTAVVLMFSDLRVPAATVYPDSDKIGIWTGNRDDDVMVPRSAKVGYYHGQPGV